MRRRKARAALRARVLLPEPRIALRRPTVAIVNPYSHHLECILPYSQWCKSRGLDLHLYLQGGTPRAADAPDSWVSALTALGALDASSTTIHRAGAWRDELSGAYALVIFLTADGRLGVPPVLPPNAVAVYHDILSPRSRGSTICMRRSGPGAAAFIPCGDLSPLPSMGHCLCLGTTNSCRPEELRAAVREARGRRLIWISRSFPEALKAAARKMPTVELMADAPPATMLRLLRSSEYVIVPVSPRTPAPVRRAGRRRRRRGRAPLRPSRQLDPRIHRRVSGVIPLAMTFGIPVCAHPVVIDSLGTVGQEGWIPFGASSPRPERRAGLFQSHSQRLTTILDGICRRA